jgi:hypothetical protein
VAAASTNGTGRSTPARSTRDPEASDSFTLAQLDAVNTVADRTSTTLQTGEGWVDDPHFLGRLTRTLAYTGAHISVLSGGWRAHTTRADPEISESKVTTYEYSPPIRSDAIKGEFLYWRRPKNEKPIPMPIKKEVAPWLGLFFDQAKPRSRQRYNQILDELEPLVGFSCNPLRFRHTCGVLLYHVYKMPAADVQRLMGFTPETMLTYVVRTKEEIREEMVAKGW